MVKEYVQKLKAKVIFHTFFEQFIYIVASLMELLVYLMNNFSKGGTIYSIYQPSS